MAGKGRSPRGHRTPRPAPRCLHSAHRDLPIPVSIQHTGNCPSLSLAVSIQHTGPTCPSLSPFSTPGPAPLCLHSAHRDLPLSVSIQHTGTCPSLSPFSTPGPAPPVSIQHTGNCPSLSPFSTPRPAPRCLHSAHRDLPLAVSIQHTETCPSLSPFSTPRPAPRCLHSAHRDLPIAVSPFSTSAAVTRGVHDTAPPGTDTPTPPQPARRSNPSSTVLIGASVPLDTSCGNVVRNATHLGQPASLLCLQWQWSHMAAPRLPCLIFRL